MVNPILHTAWLNNHALTLKRNTAKYYFGEKSSFLHTFLPSWCGVAQLWCGVAQLWCSVAQLWCGVAQLWCGVAQFWCGVAQLWRGVAHLWCSVAGRQARVRFSAQHHREIFPH
jgi:hypothetical protein